MTPEERAHLHIGTRLPASAGELERCRLWALHTFAHAQHRGDHALEVYVIEITIAWDKLCKLLRPWRRYAPWNRVASVRRGYALKIGYRGRRLGGRYRPRKRRAPAPVRA